MKRIISFFRTFTITLGLLAQSQVQGAQFTALNLSSINLLGAAGDSSNNTYVLGIFTNTLNIGGKTLVSRGGSDYVLAQYRADGTVGWAISFGTAQDEGTAYTTLNVSSSAVCVSGTTGGSIHVVDTVNNVVDTAYIGRGDGFLLHFSLAGVTLWQASLTSSSAGDNAYNVSSDIAGNVYWVGCFNGCCPSQGIATLTGGDGTSVALTTPSYATAQSNPRFRTSASARVTNCRFRVT